MGYQFKSCFVSEKHLDAANQCTFCKKKIIDVRGKTLAQINNLADQGVCVQTSGNQLTDTRSLKQKIIGAVSRAKSASSGFRFAYLLIVFVSMTIFTSCRRHVMAGTFVKGVKKKNLPQVGFAYKSEAEGNKNLD